MSEFFQRNLPHYHLPNAAYFITFRLAGSAGWQNRDLQKLPPANFMRCIPTITTCMPAA